MFSLGAEIGDTDATLYISPFLWSRRWYACLTRVGGFKAFIVTIGPIFLEGSYRCA